MARWPQAQPAPETPLWYYILKEAAARADSKRLGPVGSRILSEVFVGLVHGDHKSFLWQRSNWTPELPGATPATSPWPTC